MANQLDTRGDSGYTVRQLALILKELRQIAR